MAPDTEWWLATNQRDYPTPHFACWSWISFWRYQVQYWGWMKFFYPDYVALDPKMGVAVHPLLYLTLSHFDSDRWTFGDILAEGYPDIDDDLWDRRRPLTSQLETGFVQKWHEIDHYDWPERRFLETEEVKMVKEYQVFNWGNA